MAIDSYGLGLKAYLDGDKNATFIVESDVAETEEWPVSLFFHKYEDMEPIERCALSLCNGRTLDVGAGSGCHSLWLQNHAIDAEALDISPLAIEVAQQQGVKKTICADFFNFHPDTPYDTLLFLMNGIGICGTLDNLDNFLQTATSLLAPDGQIILDSSDLIYLYEEEDGSFSLPLNGYYGELNYTFSFDNKKSASFPWVFIDPNTLSSAAERNGLSFEIVLQGEHYDFLARLKKK